MYCTRHHIFVDYGNPCPVCMNDMEAPAAPQVTTATALVVEAIRDYKETRDIPAWEDSLIEIAEPGDLLWTQWATDTVLPDGSILVAASGMCGNPDRSEIALRVAGEGQFYGCVEAAIADLPRYFMAEESPCTSDTPTRSLLEGGQ